jgi:uncharacterized membrane protein HdeD (DUF308 family)
MLLLAVYLILLGLIGLFNFSFSGQPVVLGILALVAGILLILGR